MKNRRSAGRRLRLESLEARQLLAVFLVDDDFTTNDPAAREFITIQAAVTAASAGDKIKVRPGTYAENVVVNKQLEIEGADAALANYLDDNHASIVDPVNSNSGPAIAFDLQADGVEITGFTIRESGTNTDSNGTIGIRTSSSHAGYTIADNVIEQNSIGIYLNSQTSSNSTPEETVVEGNLIRNNSRTDGDNHGNGIFSDQGLQNATIEDNEFSGANSDASIKIIRATGATSSLRSDIAIEHNTFDDLTGAGIYLENVVDSAIAHNDLTSLAKSGIQLNGGNQRVEIKRNDLSSFGTQALFGIILSNDSSQGANQDNVIKRNHISGAGSTGLMVSGSSSNTIVRNHIDSSLLNGATLPTLGNGVSLANADNNTLLRNVLEGNARHGIYVDSGSTGNSLTRNTSKDNAAEATAGVDFQDSTSGGSGTANTQNTYKKNKGRTSSPTGLIAHTI